MKVPVFKAEIPKPKVKSEDAEQMEFIQWMRRTHPQHRIFAIPNGGWRSKASVMKLKATGVTAGVPDLMIPSLYAFIEMKRVKNSQTSPEQYDWVDYLKTAGYSVKICKGKDEAVEFVKQLLTNIN